MTFYRNRRWYKWFKNVQTETKDAPILPKPPKDFILHYPLSGDYLDKSVNNNHGVVAGDIRFEEERKQGVMSATFYSAQISTTNPVPINGSYASVSVWVRTFQTSLAVICEMGRGFMPNSFGIFCNDIEPRTIDVLLGSADKFRSKLVRYTPEWNHYVFVIDRTSVDNNVEIYKDGVLSTESTKFNTYIGGLFTSDVLYIGSRRNNDWRFNGNMQDFKLYDRVLTPTEINLLYTE